jgi:N-carbamoyl-L-amino-acid hydrolase
MGFHHLRIDPERLRRSLEQLAEIGATEGGGVHRLALSDEDKRARDLFVSWLHATDLEVSVDEVGSIFGSRRGARRRAIRRCTRRYGRPRGDPHAPRG